MGLDAQFVNLMTDTFTVEPLIGNDIYVNPIYGPPRKLKGRLEDSIQIIRMKDGKTVVSYGVIYFSTVTNMHLNDRLTLPDGAHPIMLLIRTIKDDRGSLYDEVHLG